MIINGPKINLRNLINSVYVVHPAGFFHRFHCSRLKGKKLNLKLSYYVKIHFICKLISLDKTLTIYELNVNRMTHTVTHRAFQVE